MVSQNDELRSSVEAGTAGILAGADLEAVSWSIRRLMISSTTVGFR